MCDPVGKRKSSTAALFDDIDFNLEPVKLLSALNNSTTETDGAEEKEDLGKKNVEIVPSEEPMQSQGQLLSCQLFRKLKFKCWCIW